ncbi:aldehyde-activating protein [Agaribacter flavus]|uniref:Aldehyde-activating protein n=1 Tax=Agaribacter flavus TaxID=1902781 RepID=A0ABV7FPS2_9ALTE
MKYITSCSCGTIDVCLILPKAIELYRPRQCDCDFCNAYNLRYLSDVDGILWFSPIEKLRIIKQGSEQARFWQCLYCEQVIAVTNEYDGEVRGAVSSALFEEYCVLRENDIISPKTLSASEKSKRWTQIWCKVEHSAV